MLLCRICRIRRQRKVGRVRVDVVDDTCVGAVLCSDKHMDVAINYYILNVTCKMVSPILKG
jgi:hypothetical protein